MLGHAARASFGLHLCLQDEEREENGYQKAYENSYHCSHVNILHVAVAFPSNCYARLPFWLGAVSADQV